MPACDAILALRFHTLTKQTSQQSCPGPVSGNQGKSGPKSVGALQPPARDDRSNPYQAAEVALFLLA
jgi:hypothetical protein